MSNKFEFLAAISGEQYEDVKAAIAKVERKAITAEQQQGKQSDGGQPRVPRRPATMRR